MPDRLDKELDRLSHQINLKVKIAYLGDGSGSGNPRLSDNSGWMWARTATAEGFTSAVAYPVDPNGNIPPRDNMPVEIGYLGRVQTILRVYADGMRLVNLNPGTTNPSDPEAKSDVQVNLTQFLCKRHPDTINKPLTVIVMDGYFEVDGVSFIFIQSEIDLASLVPAVLEKCIACVYVKTDLTLEAFASTPKLLDDPLFMTDIDECRQQASIGSMSIWGWVLQDDQSILTEDEALNIDLRPIFTPPGGSADDSGLYVAMGI